MTLCPECGRPVRLEKPDSQRAFCTTSDCPMEGKRKPVKVFEKMNAAKEKEEHV